MVGFSGVTPKENLWPLFPMEFMDSVRMAPDGSIGPYFATSFGYDYGLYSKNELSELIKIGDTTSGLVVFKENKTDKLSRFVGGRYFVELPFGKFLRVLPRTDFFNTGSTQPLINWSVGTTSVEKYWYGPYSNVGLDCIDEISDEQILASLVQVGFTHKGDAVYEIDPVRYQAVYSCLHKKTHEIAHPSEFTGPRAVSLNDFIGKHPMFFWKHPTGDWIRFIMVGISDNGFSHD